MSAHIRVSLGCFSAFSFLLAFALSAQGQDSTNPTETVCVRVSVSDPLNRLITGLKKEHFRIYEDKAEQTIASFSQQSVPMSVGIVWDVSRGRNGGENFEGAKAAVSRLLPSRNPEDEYFFINFSESAPIQAITGKMPPTAVQIDKSKIRIPLFDAVYMGLDRTKQGKHDKRALIIISDGEETYSQHKASEIRKFANESDVKIFGIAEQGRLPNAIQDIASITGGRILVPPRLALHQPLGELGYFIDLLLAELRNQYLLCYAPTNNKHDGTLRKIEVKLDPPPKLPKLIIHARKERYVPKN
jgi:Ca-activated chloride channel homolog